MHFLWLSVVAFTLCLSLEVYPLEFSLIMPGVRVVIASVLLSIACAGK